ncbi:GNAT family N-acetyltransferase [Candidatus Micrarchaeota archaeon]|nr:GNAT family N-acetyltransferase [Candidatus Micrarchaeota archaeon]
MKVENIEIVPASEKHFYSLTVLTRQFFPYANFSLNELKKRTSARNVKYFLAKVGGGTVGFVDFEIVPESPESARRCKLMGLAVLEEFRGRGIARRLVEKVLECAEAEKCSRVFLLVSVDNDAAISLYASHGFESRGVTDKPINGKQVVLMEKFLHA